MWCEGTCHQAPRTLLLRTASKCQKITDTGFPGTSYQKKYTQTIILWNLTFYLSKHHVIHMFTVANKQWKREFCWDFLKFVLHSPASLKCLWYSDEAVFSSTGLRTGRTQVLGFWKSTQSREDALYPVKCIDICRRHHNKPPTAAEVSGYSASRAHEHNIFRAGWCMSA
jgi:hypothetical protein